MKYVRYAAWPILFLAAVLVCVAVGHMNGGDDPVERLRSAYDFTKFGLALPAIIVATLFAINNRELSGARRAVAWYVQLQAVVLMSISLGVGDYTPWQHGGLFVVLSLVSAVLTFFVWLNRSEFDERTANDPAHAFVWPHWLSQVGAHASIAICCAFWLETQGRVIVPASIVFTGFTILGLWLGHKRPLPRYNAATDEWSWDPVEEERQSYEDAKLAEAGNTIDHTVASA